MTNKDKFLKDGVSVDDFEDIYHDWLIKDMVLEAEREIQLDKLDSVMRFLRTPCKPTLTEDERVILKNIDKKYKYIFKPVDNELYLCETKGMRYYDEDDREIAHDFLCYSHLFQFIKERRRIRDKRIIGGKMIEDNRTYYKCEYCGNISQDYEEIETCEKTCGLIIEELTKIIDSCKKLNDLGCTIELREYPYYTDNKLDKAAARIIKKEYELAFRSEDVCIENNIKKEFKTLTTLLGDEK